MNCFKVGLQKHSILNQKDSGTTVIKKGNQDVVINLSLWELYLYSRSKCSPVCGSLLGWVGSSGLLIRLSALAPSWDAVQGLSCLVQC